MCKIVILAGGLGTRISEESHLKPKPMIEIGDKPILWHIMKSFSKQGYNEFVICAGYKQEVIKEYFKNYYIHNCDITFDFVEENKVIIHNKDVESWKVTIVDTGLNTMTGGRVKRIKKYVNNEAFILTYGDGVSNLDVKKLLKQHESSNKEVTISAFNIGQDKGILDIDSKGNVKAFREKNNDDGALINIGYMVCEPSVFNYLKNDKTIFEKDALQKIAEKGKLGAYIHKGFWQCMDTQRDKKKLEDLWNTGTAPWKTWK